MLFSRTLYFLTCTVCLLVSQEAKSQGFWSKETAATGFEPRDSSPNASVVHNGKYFVLAGYRNIDPRNWESLSDTWVSDDGINWSLINPNPPYHPYSVFLSYKGKLWAFGPTSYSSVDGVNWELVTTSQPIPTAARGTIHNGEIFITHSTTVLKTSDGVNFNIVKNQTPWQYRAWPGFVSFKNKLWFFGGGINYFTGNDYYFTDIWSSVDGATWKLETETANWPGRYWFAYKVFDQKIWLTGGWDFYRYYNSENGNLNDTWYTENGVDWTKLIVDESYPNRHASLLWCDKGWLWLSSGYGGGGVPRMYGDIWKLYLDNDYLNSVKDINLHFGDVMTLPQVSSVGLPIEYIIADRNIVDFSNNQLVAKEPGSTNILVRQYGNCDYAYSSKTIQVSISKRDVMLTVKNVDATFGDPVPNFIIQTEGLLDNHIIDSLDTMPEIVFDSSMMARVGVHPLKLLVGNDSRYNIATSTGLLNVSKRRVTVLVENEDILFGDPIPHFPIKAEGFVYNHTLDSLETNVEVIVDSLSALSVGEHPVKIKSGNDSRYDLVLRDAVLRVHPYEYYSFAFPNPANKSITVVLAFGSIDSIELINSTGQVCLRKQVDETNEVNVEDLTSGIYQVVVLSGNKTFFSKVLIQH